MTRAKRVAIVQSNYIPWKGYFDMVNLVQEFILFDDRQYTRRDWRNRNIIKTSSGSRWLTIPVEVRGRFHQRIDETIVSDPGWAERHWKTLMHSYAKAAHFRRYRSIFEGLYRDMAEARLSQINRTFIEIICSILQIPTKLTWSTAYDAAGDRSERLVALCVAAGASEYLSGPAARSYLDVGLFARSGISVSFMDYAGYPEYPQLFPPFEHRVSVLDLIFNTGPDARHYMKSFGPAVAPERRPSDDAAPLSARRATTL